MDWAERGGGRARAGSEAAGTAARVGRVARDLVKRIPGIPDVHCRYAAWAVRRRRERRWREAEACVVSFPKSGRTWLNVMLGKVVSELRGTEFTLDIPDVLFTHDNSDKLAQPFAVDARNYARKKVVFLARDPRDILASYYVHRTRRDRLYAGTLSEFIRDPSYGVARVVELMNGWWAQRRIPRAFLLVRYEDLHLDARAQLGRLVEFLEMDVLPRFVEEAVTFASFDRMKEMERSGMFEDPRIRPGDSLDPESYKVRRGEVG
ncbi:MAG: sulfotransferase domain-containing protein, partial [Planctomycetota bacterium]